MAFFNKQQLTNNSIIKVNSRNCGVKVLTDPSMPDIDCVVSNWSEWGICEDGTQERTRTVLTPQSGNGLPCPVLVESRACIDCPDGVYEPAYECAYE